MTAASQQAPHARATLVLACLAQFLVVLDASVVNVALPSIRLTLHFSESGLQWVLNGYTITFAGFLMFGGRAADLAGRRRTFVAGLLLFALASPLGGFAVNRPMLIGARLLQGIGGAVVSPSSLSLLTSTFTEPKERFRALGAWGGMAGVGGATGVFLGGLITSLLGWRWVLLINVPIGLALAVCSQRLLAPDPETGARSGFDLTGTLLATIGLSVLVFGIVRSSTAGWGSSLTLAAVTCGAVLLIVFLIWEGRVASAPLMPLDLFRSRALSVANVVVALVNASTSAMWFFLSLYMRDVLGYSPLKSGLGFVPLTMATAIGSVIAARVSMRIQPRILLIAAMTGLALGLLALSGITTHSSYVTGLLIPGMIVSIAQPFGFTPGTIGATAGVPADRAGLAAAVTNTARQFGGAVGLAVLATIATTASHGAVHGSDAVKGFSIALQASAGIAAVGAVLSLVAMPSKLAH